MIDNRRVPHRAFVFLVPAILIESGIVTLPGDLSRIGGNWAWLAFLIGAGVVTLNIALLVRLVLRHQGAEFHEVLQNLFGYWPGRLILCVVGLVLVYRTAKILFVAADLIMNQLLDRTPELAILIVVLLPVIYLAVQGFESIARFISIIAPFYYSLMLVTVVLAIPHINPLSLISPMEYTYSGFLQAIWMTILESEGYVLLFLFIPWSWQMEKMMGPVMWGAGLAVLLVLSIMVAGVGVLEGSLDEYSWPTFQLVQVVGIPGLLFERIDAIFFLVWVFALIDVLAITVFGAAHALSQGITGRIDLPPFVLGVSLVGMLLALWPRNVNQFMEITSVLSLPLGGFEFVLPLVLWLMTLAKGGMLQR